MFQIKMLNDSAAEVFLYGEIGWDANAGEFVRELSGIDARTLTVRINSPGGDAYEGLAIMNALRAHEAEVTAIVEGLAASAASFIAIGGSDRLVLRPQAELMIHDAMSFVGGNSTEMQKAIVDLDRISDNIASIYADRAGGEPSDWRDRMRAETWFSAQEAVDAGLADAVEDGRPVAAHMPVGVFNLSKFKHAGRAAAPPPMTDSLHTYQFSEEGNMAILNEFASMLGMSDKNPSEADVRAALREVLNEQIEVTSVIELTYPEGTTVVPTGKATITPEGEVPAGLVFAAGEAPEGWTVEVDEATGVVTVTAPSAVEPDTEVQVNVTAQGNGEPVEFPISVTVKSAAGEEEQDPAPVDPAADSVTLDRDTFNDLQAAAKLGWEAKNAADKAARVSEVDKWISEGRINTAHRAKVIAAMENDADKARALFGSIPKNTIPRGEAGYGADDDAAVESDVKQRAAKALRTPNLY